LVAVQAGGYDAPWTTARVLAPLLIGLLLVVAFAIWEWKLASQPLIPKEIFRGQRAVAMCFTAAFVGGMNFYSLLNFFPGTYTTVYVNSPIHVGFYGFGWGFSVAGGAAFWNFMLSIFKKHNREVLILCAIIMSESNPVVGVGLSVINVKQLHSVAR
jgi:hypothetical protein